jgi:hypothetical protein
LGGGAVWGGGGAAGGGRGGGGGGGGLTQLIALVVAAVYGSVGVQYFGVESPESFCDFFHSFYTMFGIVAYSQPPPGLELFDSDGQVPRSGGGMRAMAGEEQAGGKNW